MGVWGFGLLGAHEGEEDDVADGARAGEEHGEAVDADAFAGGRRQAVAEGADVVVVHRPWLRRRGPFGHLGFEAAALVGGVVELGEGVADFEAADVELEALDPVGLVGLDSSRGGDGEGEVVDDGGLDEMGFGEELEESRWLYLTVDLVSSLIAGSQFSRARRNCDCAAAALDRRSSSRFHR